MWKQNKFSVSDHSHVGEVRRFAQMTAQEMGFEETLVGKISIVVTEMATNIVKHAGKGEVIIVESPYTLHVLALDNGPGMNIDVSMIDGYSTGGTAGTGLGAIRRGSTFFDIMTVPSKGTVVYVNFCNQDHKSDYLIGAINVPYPGEEVSGDSWSSQKSETGYQLLVADGLGHGLMAHQASDLATKIFEEAPVTKQENFLHTLHLALRSTRGAAVSIATYHKAKRVLHFCGVGNVLGMICGPGITKRCITYNGTLGVQMRKVQSLPYPLDKDSFFLMMSDGISTQAALNNYPGIYNRHPFILASVIYRDFGKSNDDATVIVFKDNE